MLFCSARFSISNPPIIAKAIFIDKPLLPNGRPKRHQTQPTATNRTQKPPQATASHQTPQKHTKIHQTPTETPPKSHPKQPNTTKPNQTPPKAANSQERPPKAAKSHQPPPRVAKRHHKRQHTTIRNQKSPHATESHQMPTQAATPLPFLRGGGRLNIICSLGSSQHACKLTKITSRRGQANTRDGTQTHNLRLRREAPYPLGHTSS